MIKLRENEGGKKTSEQASRRAASNERGKLPSLRHCGKSLYTGG